MVYLHVENLENQQVRNGVTELQTSTVKLLTGIDIFLKFRGDRDQIDFRGIIARTKCGKNAFRILFQILVCLILSDATEPDYLLLILLLDHGELGEYGNRRCPIE